MMNAEILRDAEQRRLAWRCRRGMLELDIVLQRFVATRFDGLTLAEMTQFDALLELPDTQFWALIQEEPPAATGARTPVNIDQQAVLQKLRASRHPAEQENA